MGPGGTYALVTFCSGLLLLAGWFYATADNPRAGEIFRKSVLLFGLPILFLPPGLFQFPLGMWALVACEECLKALASTREESGRDKFWLVALFGIWELTVAKPFWGVILEQSGESWDRLALAGFLYATVLPVLMHSVTAAIYAFTFRGKMWVAIIVSWMVHVTFNETATYFFLSPPAVIVETAILVLILMAIVSHYRGTDVTDRPPN